MRTRYVAAACSALLSLTACASHHTTSPAPTPELRPAIVNAAHLADGRTRVAVELPALAYLTALSVVPGKPARVLAFSVDSAAAAGPLAAGPHLLEFGPNPDAVSYSIPRGAASPPPASGLDRETCLSRNAAIAAQRNDPAQRDLMNDPYLWCPDRPAEAAPPVPPAPPRPLLILVATRAAPDSTALRQRLSRLEFGGSGSVMVHDAGTSVASSIASPDEQHWAAAARPW
jgi:hypothetical protein